MSVPPEMMQAMSGGGAPGAAPPGAPPGGAGGPEPGPNAAGMMTPQTPQGQQEGSKVDVMLATKMLERSIVAFGVTSKEGKAILTALKTLGSAFGEDEEKTQELMPAEIRQMMQQLAGPGAEGGAPPGAPQ